MLLEGQVSSSAFVMDIHPDDRLEQIVEILSERNWTFAYAPKTLSLKPCRSGHVTASTMDELFELLFPEQT